MHNKRWEGYEKMCVPVSVTVGATTIGDYLALVWPEVLAAIVFAIGVVMSFWSVKKGKGGE